MDIAYEQPVIELRNVYMAFVTRTRHERHRAMLALEDISCRIQRGSFVTLVGPSGCGKSTVLRLIAGLLRPTSGQVLYKGRPVEGVNTDVGFVTQDDNLFPWRNLLENVQLALEFKGVPRSERERRALELIERVGLRGFEYHYPHELSGGMRKRAAIIRTLIYDPDVILMDEPFGPLDAQTRTVLQDELLKLWQGSGKTILFVTHDLVESVALSDRILVFTRSPGRIFREYLVDIPRPRDVFHIHEAPGFARIFDSLWRDIRSQLGEGQPAERSQARVAQALAELPRPEGVGA